MDADMHQETCVEFTQTIQDERTGFVANLTFIVGPCGVVLAFESGSANNASSSSIQGKVALSLLRSMLTHCGDDEGDALKCPIAMETYDMEDRSMVEEKHDLTISICDPINFRPFLRRYLPIIIRCAELMESDGAPVPMTTAKPASC